MKPEIAQAIVRHVKDKGVTPRMTTAVAQGVLTTWIKARGWESDRFGNFLNPDNPSDRYHFSKQVMHRQEKDGDWRNRDNLPMIDSAVNLIVAAAVVMQDAELEAAFRATKGKRKEERQDRAKKADDDKLEVLAHRIALKELAFELPRQMVDAYTGKAKPAQIAKLNEEIVGLRNKWQEHLAGHGETPDDGQFASADRPPVIPVVGKGSGRGAESYRWTETVEGVPYTVSVKGVAPQEAQVEIGRQAGLSVSAFSHTIGTSDPGAEGDAYISGRVFYQKQRIGAALFLIIAGEKQKGAGTRAMSIWCRMMRGYRVERWVAQAVGPEGAAFMKALEKKGQLSLQDTQGAHWVVSCARANPVRPSAGPKMSKDASQVVAWLAEESDSFMGGADGFAKATTDEVAKGLGWKADRAYKALAELAKLKVVVREGHTGHGSKRHEASGDRVGWMLWEMHWDHLDELPQRVLEDLSEQEHQEWLQRKASRNPARKPVPGFDERAAYARAIEKYVDSLPEGTWARIIVVANPWETSVHEVRRYASSAEAHKDKKLNDTGGTLVHKPKPFPKYPEWLAEDLRNPVSPRTTFTTKDAQDAAAILGIDFSEVPFDVEQFRRGMVVELEHGTRDPRMNVTNDTLMVTAMIAWAHLNELPDYYYRLAAMEKEGERDKKRPTQKPKVGIRPTQVTEGSIFAPKQKPGFLVYGTDLHGRKIGYAVKERAQAEAIRDEFKAGKPGYRHRASEILQGQQIDAYYANPAHPERVVVEKGMLVQFVFPASHLALSMYSDAPVSFWIKFQLFAADTGKPATGDYRGQGTVVDRDGKHYLLLGDPNRKAYLDEYIIADEADPESIKALDEFEAGVKAAIGEFKPGRRVKNKGENWLDGYDQSMRYRKQVDGEKRNPAAPCPCKQNPARASNPMFDKLDEAVLKALSRSGPGTVRDAIWQSVTDNFWDWTNNIWKDETGTVFMPRDVGDSLKRLQHRGLAYSHDGRSLAVWNRGSKRKGGSTYRYWSTRKQLIGDGYSEADLPRGK